MHVRSILVIGSLVVGACSSAPAKTPAGGPISCRSDGDCVVTDTIGCCACCKSDPRALPRVELERQEHACEARTCEACGDRLQCPKVASVEGAVAKCTDGTCVVSKILR